MGNSLSDTSGAPEPETIVFIDCPDPDNFMLVVGAALLHNCRHVVVTGRPANFDIKSRPRCAASSSVLSLDARRG